MNGQLPGLDLGQIQNFVDQVQQVAAAFVDHPGRLGLLGGEVALLVVGQLAGQNQHAVQRGAQLMRHIGQELGLVLRGLLQLPGRRLELGALPGQHLAFLFQLLVGRPQLFTLLLEFFLGLAQRLRLFLQFFIGDPQLLLLLLQARGHGSRLLQQLLGALLGFQSIQRQGNRFRNAIQQLQGLLRRPAVPGQFQQPHHAALATQGHQCHRAGQGLAQTRCNRQIVSRQVCEQERPLGLERPTQLAMVGIKPARPVDAIG